jgi:hypothetical protein
MRQRTLSTFFALTRLDGLMVRALGNSGVEMIGLREILELDTRFVKSV